MKKRFLLSKEQVTEVEKAMKSTRPVRECKRLQAIYLYGTNLPIEEVMRLTQLKRSSINNIYRRYQIDGLDCIHDAKRSGRPSRLTKQQEGELRDVFINRIPADLGFTAHYNWTAGIVAKFIKKTYGYTYSLNGVTLIIKRMNLSFSR
ncbi:MAG: transposase (21) [Firmicutes bacterium]|nr:transposase (21) [Bacillota bacterium]